MNLFLLRHAEAANTDPDASRELTPFAREQIRDLVTKLDRADFRRVRRIEHSPLVRAHESAQLFLAETGLVLPSGQPPQLAVNNGLLPDAEAQQLATALATSHEDRLLVGHNPIFEHLVSLLLGQNRIGIAVALKLAGCIALECFDGPAPSRPYGYWVLRWFVVPCQPPER